MSERLTDAELAEIRTAFSGRTKYEGRRAPWDERLLAEVDRLRAVVEGLEQRIARKAFVGNEFGVGLSADHFEHLLNELRNFLRSGVA